MSKIRLIFTILILPFTIQAKDSVKLYYTTPATISAERGKKDHFKISTNYCGKAIEVITGNLITNSAASSSASSSSSVVGTKEIKLLLLEINNTTYINKLIQAANAGVKVKILVNYREPDAREDPLLSLKTLVRAYNISKPANKIYVKGITGYRSTTSKIGLMHEKSALFLSPNQRVLMMGSFNWTNNASINSFENCAIFERLMPVAESEVKSIGDVINQADLHFNSLWSGSTVNLGDEFNETASSGGGAGGAGAGAGGSSRGFGGSDPRGGKGGTSGGTGSMAGGKDASGSSTTAPQKGSGGSLGSSKRGVTSESAAEEGDVPEEGVSTLLPDLSPLKSRSMASTDLKTAAAPETAAEASAEDTDDLVEGVSLHKPDLSPQKTASKLRVLTRSSSKNYGTGTTGASTTL